MTPVATVDGPVGPIAYRRAGTGRAVLLLHPLALSSASYRSLQHRLAASYDVIAVDARGHGDSGWDNEPFGVNDMAGDVVALMDTLGLARAHMVGMSMGGSVAVVLAAQQPERVSRMFLADTTAWYGENAEQTWRERARRAVEVPRVDQVAFQVDR